jgi:hypothetical protein
MKQTQFIRNNARLRGGKKPPKPKEFDRADDVMRPGELVGPPNLEACRSCYKEVSPHNCSDCAKVMGQRHD